VSEDSDEPLEDVVGLILDFDELKNKPSKWQIRNDQGEFEKLSPDIFSFDRDSLAITIETIKQSDLDYLEKKSESNIEPIAVIDKWEIYFPTNIPESVEIANKGKLVNWCTGRTSNNLFYAYVLNNTFLFYILEVNNPTNKYCVGVQTGRIAPGDRHGGVTVDMHNDGFDDNYQNKVFGNDIKLQIHQKLLEINSNFNKIHPARSIPLKAMGNLKTWKQMVGPWSKDNRKDFLKYWFNSNVYEDSHMSTDVLKHIIYNPEYYKLGNKIDSFLHNIIKIYSIKIKDNQKLYNIVHSTADIDSWRNEFANLDMVDKLSLINLIITQSPNYNFENDTLSKDIFRDMFFWNFYEYIPKNTNTSNVRFEGLKAYYKKFKNKNTEFDKLIKNMDDIEAWRFVINKWPKELVHPIISSDELPILPKLLAKAITANADNNVDIKAIITDIITNHNGIYAKNSIETLTLEEKFGDIYVTTILGLPKELNVYNKKENKSNKSKEFRLNILKNENLWNKYIIKNKIPSLHVANLFGFLLSRAKISDIKEFNSNVVKQLITILEENKSQNDRSHTNNSTHIDYLYQYLIILNNGLDLKFLTKLTNILNVNKFDIIYSLFVNRGTSHNLAGTGLIKKEIYHVAIDVLLSNFRSVSDDQASEHAEFISYDLHWVKNHFKLETFNNDQELIRRFDTFNSILNAAMD
jgi:hypothetical protein